MMKFENEVLDRDRVISELKAENKTLEKILQQREADYLVLQEAFDKKEDLTAQQDVVILENKVREYGNIIRY